MEELKRHIESAFRILDGWSVSGEMVEQMAMARIHLKQALNCIHENEEKEEEKHGD